MNVTIFLFILVFFLLSTKLSLSFSHIRGVMMSTKGGFLSWNHIAHILVSYLLTIRKTPGFSALTHRVKNPHNVASFYIRNVHSASIKPNEDRFPHEIQALKELNGVVDEWNAIRQKHHSTPFHIVGHEHRFVSMQHPDVFLKLRDQIDYRALPTQADQNVLHMLYCDWKSFFTALTDYKTHPDKYETVPHIPWYAGKNGYKPLVFTNQICKPRKDKHDWYVRFPKVVL